MKKEFIIPVGKINAVITFGVGLCTSALVNKALKKVSTGNRIIDSIGRDGASTLIGAGFTMMSAKMWDDDSMDIKVPTNTMEIYLYQRNVKKLNEAMDLWNDILARCIEARSYLFNHPTSVSIPIDMVPDRDKIKKFNTLMTKIVKKTGAEFTPIDVNVMDKQLIEWVAGNAYKVTYSIRSSYDHFNAMHLSDDSSYHDGIKLITSETGGEIRDMLDAIRYNHITYLPHEDDAEIINTIFDIFMNAGYPESEVETLIKDMEEVFTLWDDAKIVEIVNDFRKGVHTVSTAYHEINECLIAKRLKELNDTIIPVEAAE